MKIRLQGERHVRAANLERLWRLQVEGTERFRPGAEVELVSATRVEREALRKAGFVIRTRRSRRAA